MVDISSGPRHGDCMDVVAERALEIELPGEAEKRTIRVLVGRPEQSGDDWSAPYEIHGPGAEEVVRRAIHGVDALQALALAIHLLPAELARYERRGRVTQYGCVGFSLGLPSATVEGGG